MPLGPIVLIVVAIAGLVFGEKAAQGALTDQFRPMIGPEGAEMLQTVLENAGKKSSRIIATIIGIVTLGITASGVFGEMQSALNMIWKAKPRRSTISQLIRARAASLGLVATLGFLLLISLVVSAALSLLGDFANAVTSRQGPAVARRYDGCWLACVVLQVAPPR
jgi:membrane protein